jgi:phage terminase large subunit-like protein
MSVDYASRALWYAEKVVAGDIPTCKLLIAACQRHLDDLERASQEDEAFAYRFSVDDANRICGFTEGFPHIKGHWAKKREKIRLEDWQCVVLCVSHG